LKKKKKSWLIQVYEEEEKAAQLNVYIHLLNFSALFVGQMMLSIKQKKEMNYLYMDEVFFSSLRIVYVSSFSHHANVFVL
jgi:hypothetical protein